MTDSVSDPLHGEEAANFGRRLIDQATAQDRATVRDALREVWTDPVIDVWLTSANSFLDGARPVDVLALSGPEAVLEAVRQEVSGGYR